MCSTIVYDIDNLAAAWHKQRMNEKELYRRVGRAIADRRNELGLTQEEVARQLGLSRASLANIETGRQKILLHYLYLIATALKVSRVEDLLPAAAGLATDTPQEIQIGGDELTNEQRAEVALFFARSTPTRSTQRSKSKS